MTQHIFWTDTLPHHWIALGTDTQWYMWPATGTWKDRRRYRGHLVGLQPADTSTTRQVVTAANQQCEWSRGADTVWIAHNAEPGMPPEVLTLDEAADILGITASTLGHSARDGRLRAYKRGRQWFVLRSEIDRYARERRQIGHSRA